MEVLTPTKDFNFVADTVSGFLAVAEAEAAAGRVVNVGSGEEISIGDLVELIFRVTDITAEVVTDEVRLRPEKSEVERLLCDNSIARKLTGWRPEYTLEEGLKITARWMKNNLHTFNSGNYAL